MSTGIKTLRVLGVIPARGGSKGIPRKNVALLHGKPLLAHTAEVALTSKRLARVILSTEDEAIAAIGRDWGLQVPFLRPTELAQDETPMLPVLQHAVRTLEESGEVYDAVCLLQPTSPLRDSDMIDSCIALFERSGADTVISVCEVPHRYNPHWVYVGDPGKNLQLSTGEAVPISRRQALPPAWHREGSVYLVRRNVLMEQGSLYGDQIVGYVVDQNRTVNIDEPADLERAQMLLNTVTLQAARD